MRAVLMFTVTERRETATGSTVEGKTQMVGGLKLSPSTTVNKDHPLYDEMKKFYAWTPGGQIDFSTVNGAVLDAFTPGTICRIVIEPYTEVEVPGTQEQAIHLMDVYAALGVEWGQDIFAEIKRLQDLAFRYESVSK